MLYQATGAYAQAEPLPERALGDPEKALGPRASDTAQSLGEISRCSTS